MSLATLLIVFAVSLIFVLVSIIKFKMHPFLSLLIGGIIMGVLSGMKLTDIANGLAKGFGSTMESIGIIIIFGVALGHLLHISGATEQIAALMLKLTGKKNTPLAINLTGYIVSIPVFFDAAFVILVNLAKSLSRKGKVPFITLVTALSVGLITTHALVIPTPGPIAVAGTMGANVGWFLLYSIIVSLPASIMGGVVFGKYLGKKKQYVNDFANAFDDEEVKENENRNQKLPSGSLGIFLIFLPIVIILLGTVASMILEADSAAYVFFNFIGNKNIALLIGLIVAYICLRPYIKNSFNEVITEAATQSGIILAITGAGGAFGKIINDTGIGTKLVEGMSGLTSGAGIAMIIAAFVISQVLRAAQGSTTVALVTTSAIFAPIVAGTSVSPILVGLAICAGGIGISLPNDSGFWVVNRFSKFDVKQTMQVWTIGGTISGVTALVMVIILALLSNVLPGLL